MKKYEIDAIVKFMLIYFVSIFIFILLAGHFYYKQEKSMELIKLAVKMHEFQQKVKKSDLKYKDELYSYEILDTLDGYRDIKLPIIKGNNYIKVFPYYEGKGILIKRDVKEVKSNLLVIKKGIIFYMIGVSVFFLILSYVLAILSLKPMQDIILHLDNFTKELIHDINTPISSILLNIRGLKKTCSKESIKIKRIEDSTKSIVSLYENLEIILIENQLEFEKIDLFSMIDEKIKTYKELYPNIVFETDIKIAEVFSNEKAFERVLDNIISNSCKYSKDTNPKIELYTKDSNLIIKDNGKGMQSPQKVFEKNYTESSGGHGIGMYIVHRLATMLDIDIEFISKNGEGTKVILTLF